MRLVMSAQLLLGLRIWRTILRGRGPRPVPVTYSSRLLFMLPASIGMTACAPSAHLQLLLGKVMAKETPSRLPLSLCVAPLGLPATGDVQAVDEYARAPWALPAGEWQR